jgi:hypothetical protein
VLGLGPYVIVDPDGELDLAGPQIIFTGANIHIESGQVQPTTKADLET